MNIVDYTKNNILKKILYTITIISIIFVVKFYKSYHDEIKKSQVICLYEQMLFSYKKKDFISVLFHANNIDKNYSDTIYANVSKLFLAKNAFINKKYKKTKKHLKSIKYNKCTSILKNIINERLIKVYILQGKWKKSLILLNYYDKENKNNIYQEIKGDIYLKLNEFIKAKNSYLIAKNTNSKKINNCFLDIKIKYLSVIN